VIIDMDQHMYERPEMWAEYCDPSKRHLALTIEPDELGHWWLTSPWLGRRISYAYVSRPRDGFKNAHTVGGHHGIEVLARKFRSEVNYATDLPVDYWDPAARVAKLDDFGIDVSIALPHWAGTWANVRRGVWDHLEVLRANMEAWNRRAIDIQQQGAGRLMAIGLVSLRGGDQSWLGSQLSALSTGGVRAAMLTYGLQDDRPLSHTDHDRAWSAFVEHGIIPVFHIQDATRNSGLSEEWFTSDHDQIASALEMPFYAEGVRLALADLALNGTLERHRTLRVCVIEFCAQWFGQLLAGVDHAYRFHGRVTGRHIRDLPLMPSEYLLSQVRLVAHWAQDDVPLLAERYPDNVMFGGDYPHCEGLLSPYADFSRSVGPLPEPESTKFYGRNAGELLDLR